MRNFSATRQIETELHDFFNTKIPIAVPQQQGTNRYLRGKTKGYFFNQHDLLTIVDLYWNSAFENGEKDSAGRKKIFLNTGRFRTEIAEKQIDLDLKHFRFTPADFADPYTAILMSKEFKDWAKDHPFSEQLNDDCANYPKYGTVVSKAVGDEILDVPLSTLRNEQSAKSLKTAAYVIEEHADMRAWELKDAEENMGWSLKDLDLKMDDKVTVYERYGHVPLGWLKKHNGEKPEAADWDEYVDAVVIAATKVNRKVPGKESGHIFFAEQIDERPYEEVHYLRQEGRWLGIGEMEKQIPNQIAKNIIVNLLRKSLHWSGKRVFESTTTDLVAKSLATDVADGDVIEVGPNGSIRQVDMTQRAGFDFQAFLAEFERNSDQTSFTYETAIAGLHSNQAFRTGALLTQAAQNYYDKKREKLGLFEKRKILNFIIPKFLSDKDSTDRIISVMSDEEGYGVLKEAAMKFVRSEAAKLSLMSGKPVDGDLLVQVVSPYESVKQMLYSMRKGGYEVAKYKFDLDPTDESTDIEGKVQVLMMIYNALAAKGDPRADMVLERAAALQGESFESFGVSSGSAGASPLIRGGGGGPAMGPGGPVSPRSPGSSALTKAGGPVVKEAINASQPTR